MKVFAASAKEGFTLVELLVAVTIFALLSVLVFTVVNNTANVISLTSKGLDTSRVARECFDLMGDDLAVMSSPYDNRVSYNATPTYNSTKQNLELVVNPTGVSASYCQPHTMFWQAPISRSSTNGNLAVIGYYVLRDLQSNPKNNRLQLRRLYVEPETTSPAPTSPEYLIYSTPTAWFPNSLLSLFAPATAAADNGNGQEGWVADGVLAMWIRCLDPNGNPIVKKADGTALTYTYDSRNSYQYKDSSNVVHYPSLNAAALPAYIEVGLVCTSPSDASHIAVLPTPSALDPTQFYQEINTFTQAAKTLNRQDKSIGSFTRKFRIYSIPSS